LARTLDYELHAPGAHVDIFCDPALIDCSQHVLEIDTPNKLNPDWMENTVSSSLTTILQGFGQFVGHDMTAFSEGDFCVPPNDDTPEEARAYLQEHDRFRWFTSDPFPPPAGPGGTPKNLVHDWMNVLPTVAEVGADGVKRSINHATGILDLSLVYGATQERFETVTEDFSTGTGKLVARDLVLNNMRNEINLPFLHPDVVKNQTYYDFTPTYEAVGKNITQCELATINENRTRFYCGDSRCGTNVLLFMWHLAYFRTHNMLADELKAAHPTWSGEELYNEARRINTNRYQANAKKYFQILTGQHRRYVYQGYDSQLNPTIDVVTAFTMRFHTVVADEIRFLDECGRPTGGINPPSPHTPPIPGLPFNKYQFSGQSTRVVRDIFMLPYAGGLGNMIRGMSREPSGEMDHIVTESLRIQLQSSHDFTGISITANTIHRSRNDGVETFDQVRQRLLGRSIKHTFGCWCEQWGNGRCQRHRLNCFKKVAKDERIALKLQQLYGNVEEIDMWTGVQAETNLPGASVGRVGRAILLSAFDKVMHGDRFWFENPDEHSEVDIAHARSYTLKDTILDAFPEVDGLDTFLPPDVAYLPPFDSYGTNTAQCNP